MSEEGSTTRVPVVGIGASAGGLEALTTFLAGVPPSPGAAFVVIQHLDPHHPSLMAELLSKASELPARQLTEDVDVEPDVVYCLPPGGHALLDGDRLLLVEPDAPRGHRLPVDRFFASLAESRGPLAMAVILSGTGSDGTLGAQAVKEAGGVVVVQEPEEATHAGMPESVLRRGCQDAVLPAGTIAETLLRYLHHDAGSPEARTGDTGVADLEPIIEHIRQSSKHDFGLYKPSTIRRRIARRMGLTQSSSLEDYLSRLRSDPGESQRLLRDIFIGVTRFFRDPEVWQTLATEVRSSLLSEMSPGDPIRVWVPGCSTGEEALTMAMMLTEGFSALGREPEFQVFATDVDERAIEQSRTGTYPKSVVEELSDRRRERFFEMQGESYIVRRRLRERVVFSVQNLLTDPPFSRLDLITCRNVLIYLKPEAQRRALSLFHFALQPGGLLVLGSSETPSQQRHLFDSVSRRYRIYRPTSVRPSLPPFSPSGRSAPRGLRLHRLPSTDPKETARRALLERYAPAALLIDDRDRILYEHGPTSRFLGRPSGEPTQDLHELLHDELKGRVRRALGRSRRAEEPERLSLVLQGEETFVEVWPLEGRTTPKGWALIGFRTRPGVDESAAEEASDDPSVVAQLEEELRETRNDLQALIEDYETSNEELKASNEEVMSMNEELQSSNEELETSKEELQSLNEELTTVNSELQEKIREFEEANDDLTNLVNSTRIPTLFLDEERRIKRFTPATAELFHLIPTDVGRPIGDLSKRFSDDQLVDDVQAVLDELTPREREVSTESGRRVVRRIHPYRTGSDRITGAVLSFVDVTSLYEAREEASERLVELEQLYQHSPVGLGFIDRDFRFVRLNQRLATINGLSVEDHLGHTVRELFPDQAERFEEIHRRVWSKGEPVEDLTIEFVPHGHAEPRRYLASYFPYRGADGSVGGTMAAIFDITEREELRESLASSRARYLKLLELVDGAVLEADDDGTVLFANRAARRLLEAELVGAALTEVLPGVAEDTIEELLGHRSEERETPPVLELSSGRRFRAHARALGEGGRRLLHLTDLSVELEATERLQEQQKMEAVGRLAAGVAHDFNNLLQGLLGHAETIETITAEESVRTEARAIAHAISSASVVVGQLQGFGRQSRDEQAAIELVAAIRDALQLARATIPATTELRLSAPDEERRVRIPKADIVQLLLNLVTNAYQASGEATPVEITVRLADESQQIVLEVSDQGEGMSEEVQGRIFEPYFTTKAPSKGTGLGLSVVHGIVERAEGRVTVDSREGEGTTVYLWLPTVDGKPEPEPEAEEPEVRPSAEGKGERIFIVDDEGAFVRAASRILERAGFRPRGFSHPQDALDAFLEDPQAVDALVTDMTMPGMRGLSLIARMRETRPELPALLCTGNRADVTDAPADIEVLEKPIPVHEIARRLRALLETDD